MASPAPNGTSAAPEATKSKTTAADVGWQFVPQYYTMLHDAPERLHCFYNKKSTFVHGVEGEVITASYGQQEIHQKVMSLGFSNCKAYIHHIDAQTSFSGGIILQVIGEISNNSGPWRKFTQTFFLAEQPNGYFVLNDIFRYLKEDDEEEEDHDEEEVESATEAEQATQAHVEQPSDEAAPSSSTAESIHPISSEPIKVDSDAVLAAGQPSVSALAEAAPAVEKQEPEPTANVPETPAEVPQEPAISAAPVETPAEEKEKHTEEQKAAPVKEVTPAPPSTAATPEPAPAPAQQPAQQRAQQSKSAATQRQPSTSGKQAATVQQQQPPATPSPAPTATATAPAPAAAQPPKPAAPRTWASTAAAKPNAWGTALATKEALSASAATGQAQQKPTAQRTPSSQQQAQQTAQPAQQSQAGQGKQQPQGASSAKFPLVEAARTVQTPICFVKLNNWQAPDGAQPLDEQELRHILNKYGDITKVEIVRDKACAFVEFTKVESARRAIIASLLVAQGGEGGIKTDKGHRIIVESRKEKSERKAGTGASVPAQGQGQPQTQAQGHGQGQGQRRQGQAQNNTSSSNQTSHQNQNQSQNRTGGGMRGGRGGRTGQSGQAGNAK